MSVPTLDPPSNPMGRFSLILWEPQDPINMGAVVRACRNTRIDDIRLIRPGSWNPQLMYISAPRSEAFIDRAVRRFDAWELAVEDTHRLFALTARGRREKNLRFRIDQLVEHIVELTDATQRIGFVFGREDAGLPNHIIDRCDGYITLESAEDYASLNLAQAVLLVVWSLFKRFGDPAPMRAPQRAWPPAEHAQIERFMSDVELALEAIDVFRGDQRENVLSTVRQTFLRAQMDTQELATFWGVFKAVLARDKRR